MDDHPRPLLRWAIFGISSLLFVISQFYRASVAVITPQLIDEFNLKPTDLGLLSAVFFYAFALAQIPVGIFLDRIGARITMTVLSLVAVVGSLVFAWADSLSMLVLARVLLGLGMACNLMGTLKLLTLWFSPMHFATLVTVVMSLATAGSIGATSPLVLLVQAVGWRTAFNLFAVGTLLATVAFWLIVRDHPRGRTADPATDKTAPTLRDTLSDLRQLFRNRSYWIISLGAFGRYGIYAAVQTLWAGPFLIRGIGMPPMTAGNLILLMNVGLIVGGPIWGHLSDNLMSSRKRVIMTGLFCMGIALGGLIALNPDSPLWIFATLFFALGFCSSSGMVMYAHIKELMPLEQAGVAMTGVNFFTMIGAAVFLQGMGGIMQYIYAGASMGLGAFRGAFTFCTVSLAVVTLLYALTTDTRPGDTDR